MKLLIMYNMVYLHALKVPIEDALSDISIGINVDFRRCVIFSWKNNDILDHWVTNLYEAKGGDEDNDDLIVEITEGDLLQLQSDIQVNQWPDENLFFSKLKTEMSDKYKLYLFSTMDPPYPLI